MAQKRKRKDMTRTQRKDYRTARRDVRLAVDPVLEQINRAQQQANRDLERQQAHASAIYDALNAQLAPLGGQYDQQVQGISSGLNDSLGALSGLMAPAYSQAGVAPEDMAAAQSVNAGLGAEQVPGLNLFGTIAATGQGLLANDRARNAAYQTSTMRQSGLEEMAFGRDLLQDYKDVIDDLRQQRIDVKGDLPSLIMQRLDERRQQRFQNRLARDEFGLRETIANKQENRADQSFKHGRRLENRQQNFVLNEAERGRIGQVRKGIAPLRDDLKAVNRQIDRYENRAAPGEGSEASQYANRQRRLYKRRKQLKRKVRRKRQHIRDIRN